MMNGDAGLPHRSSSPLKRRASSMDPEADAAKNGDVEMGALETPDSGDNSSTGLPRAMSLDAPNLGPADGQNLSTQPPPPLMEQVQIIETLLKAFEEASAKNGDVAYLVSRSWLDKALALRSDSKPSKTAPTDLSLGPIDNSDIIQDVLEDPSGKRFVRLKPGADVDAFQLFPEDAWKLVMEWYGLKEGQEAIIRTAINTASDAQSEPNILYEFHPPIFRIHRLWSEVSTLPIEQSLKAKNPRTLVLARSRSSHAQTFLKELKSFTGIPVQTTTRLWVVPPQLPASGNSEPRSALTPPDSPVRMQDASTSPESWPNLLLDIKSFSEAGDSKRTVALPDQTGNQKYNGNASIQLYDLVSDQTLVLDEAIENAWVSTFTGQSRTSGKSIPTRSAGNVFSSKPNSSRSSPALDGPYTRGRAQKKKSGRSVGAVGLHNLGNTCYMNSALQCVRSVEELTKYFLTDAYRDEINETNLLGYEGRVAIAYGGLLKEIYEEGRGAVTPRDFKLTVGRCRPTFSGWSQQDSQEFLGFLLDGLQEDLSRIKKKPYIEKPDSTDDMINDPDAIREMADKVWDITRKRDDSVIADLFTGMYKSTLKCPECGKISITFDPFNNLTLPLPLENTWSKTVKFFPLNDVPVKIEVDLPRHSSVEILKKFISERTGVSMDRLMGAEEFKDRFFKMYDNSQDITEEIQQSDVPTMHELEAAPTNWPGKGQSPKKYRSMLDIDTPLDSSEWDDPRYETMVIPVLHRRPQAYGRSLEGVSPPHFITLTREEASSYDIIQRKVLERIATFSTWSKFAETIDSEKADSTDADLVVTTASDADSSGDGKVAAQSVEGEDDMVDVSMKDATDGQQAATNGQSKLLRRFKSHRPNFVNPQGFLDPELQNLFDLSYFTSDTDGAVPTGWSSVDNTRPLPKLSDRIPETSVNQDEPSPNSSNSGASGNEDSSNDEGSTTEPSQTRMNDESSEEEEVAPRSGRLNGRSGGHRQNQKGGGRKKFKGHKAYGKKGNKRREKMMRGNKQANRMPSVEPQPMPPAVADGGPLIRLHEGLVVDWNEEAWETAFGQTGRGRDPTQGARTFIDLETLHDPDLKTIQKRRHTRRTRGITLDECLDEFERAEVLSEQDMWYCPRCKEHRRASKKFDLWKTPDYLVAHLKRFSSSGWRRDKLDVLVDFPIEGLDLTSRVIQQEEGKSEVYDLIGVDNHFGGLGGGHYTAYAKNFVDQRWYNYNDSSVSAVTDPTTTITPAAYLLFYRRRSTKHLGGPRFAEIFEKFNESSSEEDEAAESGEDERVGNGTSNRGLADRGLNRKSLAAELLDLPSYQDADEDSVQRSIENGGAEMSDNYQPLGSKSLDMTQAWSFNGLDGTGREESTGPEYASDNAQAESSDDDDGRAFLDQDMDMASTTGRHDNGVVSVPAEARSEADSDDVTEIHIEGDKTTKDA